MEGLFSWLSWFILVQVIILTLENPDTIHIPTWIFINSKKLRKVYKSGQNFVVTPQNAPNSKINCIIQMEGLLSQMKKKDIKFIPNCFEWLIIAFWHIHSLSATKLRLLQHLYDHRMRTDDDWLCWSAFMFHSEHNELYCNYTVGIYQAEKWEF